MRLLFVHGWGFDRSMWDGVRAALAPLETIVWDRGYFGPPTQSAVEGPIVAVGHSLGSLLLAANPPADCAALVAINGFDRFCGDGRVAPRLLDRMRTRFADAPANVLDDFRLRAGASPHVGAIMRERLAADLDRLATLDARNGMAPRLVLHGAADPILPAPMRHDMFGSAPRIELAGAGHLLPVTHPAWCAERIREILP